jgi:hypothetical protein
VVVCVVVAEVVYAMLELLELALSQAVSRQSRRFLVLEPSFVS